MVLERELGRAGLSDTARAALQKLLDMVRSGDRSVLAEGLSYQLSQIDSPSDELTNAARLLENLDR